VTQDKQQTEKVEPYVAPNETFTTGPAKGLTPNVIFLGFISFLGDIASEMLYPIMPLFVSTYLGVPVSGLGLIEGLAEATASLLKVFSGAWTDRTRKRRPWIFAGYLLSAFARPTIGAATGWTLVTAGRLLDRVGKGLRTSPRDALLADSVAAEFRGKAFGWHRGMDTLGAVLGPLVALGLIKYLDGNLRWVFYLAFLPGLVAALTVLWIRELPATKKQTQLKWQFKELPSNFWSFTLIICLFSVCNSSDLFIFLKFQKLNSSMTELILCYCGFNLIYALLSPYLGALSDRIGKGRVFLFGLAVFAAAYTLFAISKSWVGMAGGFFVYGVYMAATEGISKALAVDLAPSHLKGTALGVLGLSAGICSLIASTTAGFLWDFLGPQAPFWLGAIGALLSATVYFLMRRNFKKSLAV